MWDKKDKPNCNIVTPSEVKNLYGLRMIDSFLSELPGYKLPLDWSAWGTGCCGAAMETAVPRSVQSDRGVNHRSACPCPVLHGQLHLQYQVWNGFNSCWICNLQYHMWWCKFEFIDLFVFFGQIRELFLVFFKNYIVARAKWYLCPFHKAPF